MIRELGCFHFSSTSSTISNTFNAGLSEKIREAIAEHSGRGCSRLNGCILCCIYFRLHNRPHNFQQCPGKTSYGLIDPTKTKLREPHFSDKKTALSFVFPEECLFLSFNSRNTQLIELLCFSKLSGHTHRTRKDRISSHMTIDR